MARTEEERAGGYLLVRYNGNEWELPTLKREGERTWKRLLPGKLGDPVTRLMAEWTKDTDVREAFGGANEAYVDALADLIVAYDATAVMGREGIETLDSDQIRDLFQRLYDIANPLDPDLQKALFSTAMAVIQQALEVARLVGPSSTNGLSPTGDTAPVTSIASSTRSSSSSSGAARKSGRQRSASAA